VIPEEVDATTIESEDGLWAGGHAQLAAFAAFGGDDERGPRDGRTERPNGNWTDRHLYALSGAEPIAEQAAGHLARDGPANGTCCL
jgi:hypothetical protein